MILYESCIVVGVLLISIFILVVLSNRIHVIRGVNAIFIIHKILLVCRLLVLMIGLVVIKAIFHIVLIFDWEQIFAPPPIRPLAPWGRPCRVQNGITIIIDFHANSIFHLFLLVYSYWLCYFFILSFLIIRVLLLLFLLVILIHVIIFHMVIIVIFLLP